MCASGCLIGGVFAHRAMSVVWLGFDVEWYGVRVIFPIVKNMTQLPGNKNYRFVFGSIGRQINFVRINHVVFR